jgi:hypothetical protein
MYVVLDLGLVRLKDSYCDAVCLKGGTRYSNRISLDFFNANRFILL